MHSQKHVCVWWLSVRCAIARIYTNCTPQPDSTRDPNSQHRDKTHTSHITFGLFYCLTAADAAAGCCGAGCACACAVDQHMYKTIIMINNSQQSLILVEMVKLIKSRKPNTAENRVNDCNTCSIHTHDFVLAFVKFNRYAHAHNRLDSQKYTFDFTHKTD